MDFKDMMRNPPEPSPEQKEFRSWLRLNRNHFLEGQYTQTEVAHFALLNGFEPMLIYRELSHFHDALNGTYIENRVAMKFFQFNSAVEQFHKLAHELKEKEIRKQRRLLGIEALWRDVARYQSGRIGGRP